MTRELPFDRARDPLPPPDELWGTPDVAPQESAADTEDSPLTEAADAQLRTLAAAHLPPDRPAPVDDMWAAISARRAPVVGAVAESPRRVRRIWPQLAALAATLVVGVAIGRAFDFWRGDGAVQANRADVVAIDGSASENASALPLMLAQLTTEHMARSEALLVTAKQDLSSESAASGTMVSDWARELLSTTRLLLDTEQITDPQTRRLLQDLELTLALILQAQASGRAMDAQAVRDELSTGDLLLRVRGAGSPSLLTTDDVRGISE